MSRVQAKDIRIVLVEPSHPGNIGGTARAMKTMGLADLAIVNPGRFPDPQAVWRAAGAVDVVDAARVFDRVDEAIADCGWVVGTSARSRRVPWPVATVEQFSEQLAREDLGGKPVAVLFGREDRGLSNEELEWCNLHVVIPANPEYPSLNLAMAVQVVCYEISRALTRVANPDAGTEDPPSDDPPTNWDRSPATAADLAALYRHLSHVLSAIEFQNPKNPRLTMTRLRRMFTRIRPDQTEVAILRGVLTRIERSLARRPPR
ncbi:MAG: RNA methyltransferase [Gammaproteobacteria bacterium]|nr:RNA methyltransferase [Gammaproteobacteria bacterium]MDE0440745.1 RNA methyltransferase [Gammaproteobacteria bacterium]